LHLGRFISRIRLRKHLSLATISWRIEIGSARSTSVCVAYHTPGSTKMPPKTIRKRRQIPPSRTPGNNQASAEMVAGTAPKQEIRIFFHERRAPNVSGNALGGARKWTRQSSGSQRYCGSCEVDAEKKAMTAGVLPVNQAIGM